MEAHTETLNDISLTWHVVSGNNTYSDGTTSWGPSWGASSWGPSSSVFALKVRSLAWLKQLQGSRVTRRVCAPCARDELPPAAAKTAAPKEAYWAASKGMAV